MTISELQEKYQAIVTDCLNGKMSGTDARCAIIALNFDFLGSLRGLTIPARIANRKLRRLAYYATWEADIREQL